MNLVFAANKGQNVEIGDLETARNIRKIFLKTDDLSLMKAIKARI